MSASTRSWRRAFALVVLAITFGMPVLVWFASVGNPADYFTFAVPPGQRMFIFAKLFALLAITMCWFQIVGALAKDTPGLAGFPRLQGRQHAYFGAATFAVTLIHVALFLLASALRTKHSTVHLLLPAFDEGFYRSMLSVGAISLWLLAVVVFAGWRRVRGLIGWRWLHRAVLIAFAGAFVHGIIVGSETRFGLMTYVYAFMGLSLLTAVVLRLNAARDRSVRSAVPLGVGARAHVD